MKSPELISFPDFEKLFIVYYDASETGLGAVLCQNEDGKLRFISYASRKFTPSEKNYHLHSGKLEFLALKWAITDSFRDYLLYGSPIIHNRSGIKNKNANYLSTHPLYVN